MCQAHHVGHAHPFNIAADLFVILLSVSSLFAVFPPSVKRNLHLKNDVISFQANSYSLHCEMENGHAANRQLGEIIFFSVGAVRLPGSYLVNVLIQFFPHLIWCPLCHCI